MFLLKAWGTNRDDDGKLDNYSAHAHQQLLDDGLALEHHSTTANTASVRIAAMGDELIDIQWPLFSRASRFSF